ncbi:hypothetical protein, partial [Janthinobacterium sp.]|uniref:hypothetical protein n=1 Tax=Janthinobacterium sp. TaxID=1871054 RepID=UPI00289948B7
MVKFSSENMLHCRKFRLEINMIKVPKTAANALTPQSPAQAFRAKRARKMSRARRSDADSTSVRQGAATPPSAFSRARVSGPLFGREKCRGQGAATQTVRQYGKELQRRHRHFLGPAS